MIILRNILAVIAGLVVGSIINMSIVTLGPNLIPQPAGVDVTDPESLARSMHLFEARHFIPPFLAHALGTLSGAFVAYMLAVSRVEIMAWLVGGLFLLGGISAVFMIPAPTWFIVLDLVVAYLPMAWLGIQVGKRCRKPPRQGCERAASSGSCAAVHAATVSR
jgi:VIT1/CCC1 family predicted Fe2+/Mn2+ transporter